MKNHTPLEYRWRFGRKRNITLLGHFLPFYPLQNPKIKILKNEKICFLHMCTKNHNHVMYGSWDMECDRQNFLSLWTIFCPFTPLWTQKIKILKKWKKHLKIYHFTNVYHKWQSYNIWFFRYGVQQTKFFIILDRFLPFYLRPLPLRTTWKIKILKNWKKPLELSSFYQKCTKNHDHVLYCSLDIARNVFNCYFSFWAII